MRFATGCMFLVLLGTSVAGCGEDRAGARDVAKAYVDAVAAEDWEAACEVSVRDDMDECVGVLREVYSDPDMDVPSVERTEAVVEEVDGRNLVDFEYVLIR